MIDTYYYIYSINYAIATQKRCLVWIWCAQSLSKKDQSNIKTMSRDLSCYVVLTKIIDEIHIMCLIILTLGARNKDTTVL